MRKFLYIHLKMYKQRKGENMKRKMKTRKKRNKNKR